MLGWFRALMPKEDRFFDLFEQHAAAVVAGATALKGMLDGSVDVATSCRLIAEHEERADAITRDTLLAVRKTFITPFDRSDIQALTSSLDDTIDQMQKTAKAVDLFEVRSFDPAMREVGSIITDAAARTAEAVPLLRAIGENAGSLNALTERIIELEGRADDAHNKGLKALFKASGSDAKAFLVGSQVLDSLEKVMDRFEDVANRMSSILIEHL